MKIKSKFNIAPILLTLTALLSLAACQDQNLDEYQQQQLNQQLSKEQAVSGSYKGSLVNQATGASMGNIEIDLTPTTTPASSIDTVSSSSQASFIGSMILYQGSVANKVDFDTPTHYYIDDNSGVGTFNGTVTIPTSTGNTKLTVTGTISGGSFSGTITNSASEPIGAFQTTLGAPFPSSAGQASSFASDPSAQQTVKYTGVLADLPGCLNKNALGQCPANIQMNISYISPNQGVAFLNNFENAKSASITLSFSNALDANATPLNIAFSQAQIDLDSGIINTTPAVYAGEINTTISLACYPLSSSPKSKTCTMITASNGAQITFVINQSASAQ